ncbi:MULTISPECIES: helix-turn-helix domain-containing protein [unclassified Streptomyces]|uniref:helix-turn-helix domain-containing protein n=1 Tax=unclassified Streptomyces TaxID=2593676 RepID=UPI003400AF1B
MPRWQELPDPLDQRVRQLVVQLRRLKDRSGLSLAALSSKTGYSRSSWERYLNGKALPPRHAVEELARVAGADPVRLLVLHEVAEEAWQQPTAPPSSPGTEEATGPAAESEAAAAGSGAVEGAPVPREDPSAPEEPLSAARPRGVRRAVAVAAVVAAALFGLGAGMLIAQSWSDGDGGRDEAPVAVGKPTPRPSSNGPTTTAQGPGRYIFTPGKSYPCKVHRASAAGAELVAGYSTTRTAVLAGPGWDVVEAQCLLSYRKMDPGIVDGVYGQQTIAAVIRLQKSAGLPADGVVGPHTWKALRG